MSQQVGPEGKFRFRSAPAGVYRLEVLHEGLPLGVLAYMGYHCPCDFDGSARPTEIVHDEHTASDWKVQLATEISIVARDKETGALVPNVLLGDDGGSEPGRATSWRNLSGAVPLPMVSAPGYGRVEVPLGWFDVCREPLQVLLEREAPLRIRCQDELGRPVEGKHWFYVHQADESCPRTLSFEADCNGMGAHSWSARSKGKSEVVIRGLPPTQGSRWVGLVGSEARTSLPGDQQVLTVTLRQTGPPTFSRE